MCNKNWISHYYLEWYTCTFLQLTVDSVLLGENKSSEWQSQYNGLISKKLIEKELSENIEKLFNSNLTIPLFE